MEDLGLSRAATEAAIAKLPPSVTLAFSPYARNLKTWPERAKGAGHEVLVVPVSFVSEHIETLYELDQLFLENARAAGIADYRRCDALNTHPAFIEALAGLVERHLEARP